MNVVVEFDETDIKNAIRYRLADLGYNVTPDKITFYVHEGDRIGDLLYITAKASGSMNCNSHGKD